ncbi:MAG TPA: hypothetical protein PLJ14_13875, partial [Accumulibacter sp.]|nr:hypothetical protein [Accumulibacter sp.]HMY07527.1 hypothetical protein [Accumulibacter sp.]HNC19209.1 hypothetical protein [Accumulibacter sp.]HNE14304.1 hypothetical protein [Accumulibacter sp.]HNK01692.1 hypothetical protein [Accumulibacter sp.]
PPAAKKSALQGEFCKRLIREFNELAVKRVKDWQSVDVVCKKLGRESTRYGTGSWWRRTS